MSPRKKKAPKRIRPKRKPVKSAHDYYFVIRGRLDAAQAKAERNGVEAIVMAPVRNSDKSIDGEVRFIRPKGVDTYGFIIDVEGWVTIPRGVWVSVGGRFEPTTQVMDHVRSPLTSRYEREQGLINLGAFFQRGKQKASVFLAARKYVSEMEVTIKRKALEIYVRLHWSPTDTQPPRVGQPVNKRRKVKSNKKAAYRKPPKKTKPKKPKTKKGKSRAKNTKRARRR